MTSAPGGGDSDGQAVRPGPEPSEAAFWSLADPIRARAAVWQRRFGLLDRVESHERASRIDPLRIEADRLGAPIRARWTRGGSLLRAMREMSDDEYAERVGIEHRVKDDVMPQFTLRNLWRVVHDVYLEDPLEFTRVRGLGGEAGVVLGQRRDIALPEKRWAEVWGVRFVARVRGMLRRLLREEPWELRFGRETREALQYALWKYIPEGTHPDDLPGVENGPELIPVPERWVPAPAGEPAFPPPPLPGDVQPDATG